jgi:hypothetical protein
LRGQTDRDPFPLIERHSRREPFRADARRRGRRRSCRTDDRRLLVEDRHPLADTTTGAASEFASLSGTLKASGASFPNAFYQYAIEKFGDVAPNVELNYNSVGSGAGKKDFGNNLVDFAGSDSTVKDGDGPAAGSFYYIPTVAAPITGLVQPERRVEAAAVRGDPGQDLRLARSPSGTTRRSRPTTPA